MSLNRPADTGQGISGQEITGLFHEQHMQKNWNGMEPGFQGNVETLGVFGRWNCPVSDLFL